MAAKHKFTKKQQSSKDRENNRKFIIVMALVTLALMALMYFAFAR